MNPDQLVLSSQKQKAKVCDQAATNKSAQKASKQLAAKDPVFISWRGGQVLFVA